LRFTTQLDNTTPTLDPPTACWRLLITVPYNDNYTVKNLNDILSTLEEVNNKTSDNSQNDSDLSSHDLTTTLPPEVQLSLTSLTIMSDDVRVMFFEGSKTSVDTILESLSLSNDSNNKYAIAPYPARLYPSSAQTRRSCMCFFF
jgi:hypothetical protein